MFSKTRTASAQMHWECRIQTMGVTNASARVKRETGRKRKRAAVTKEQEAKLGRDEKRLASLMKVENNVYAMIDDYEKTRVNNEYEGELSDSSSDK